jgi:radical SAM protein with 4Fe4S-binding SPASM domain
LTASWRRQSRAFVLADGPLFTLYRPAASSPSAAAAAQWDLALRLRGLLLRSGAACALARHPACAACSRFHACPPVFQVRRLRRGTPAAASGPGVIRGRVACVRIDADGGAARFEPGTLEPHAAADRAVGRAVRVRTSDLPARSGRPDWSISFEPAPRGARHGRGKLATIFVLRRCIADCVMCHVQEVYHGPDMPLWRIFALLEELRMLGYDRIDYFGGEPTLREDLPQALSAAVLLGCYTDIITNGMTLGPASARRLRDAGLRLAMVSLDAPTAAVHDRIRGTRGGFQRAVAGIRALARAANLRAADPRLRRMEVNIDTVVLPENVDLLEKQIRLAARLGATHVNFFLCVSAPLLAHKPMWLDYPTARRLFSEILPRCRQTARRLGITFTMSPDEPAAESKTRERFLRAVSHGIYNRLYSGGPRCAAPRDELYVTLSGEVYPCTSPTILETEHRMGNAFTRPIAEILNSPPFARFAARAGHWEACRMCWRAHAEPRQETRYLGAAV